MHDVPAHEPRVNLVRTAPGAVSVGRTMASMDHRERPSETLRQHASTYVDELIGSRHRAGAR